MTVQATPAARRGDAVAQQRGVGSTSDLAPRAFPSARDILETNVNLLTSRLLDLDEQFRMGQTDSIHELRVACCRLRTLLSCYAKDFEDTSARRLAGELSWALAGLGANRDLEVVHEYLTSVRSPHDPQADRFLVKVAQQRQFAAWDLRSTLASARYLDLLDGLRLSSASVRWRARSARAWRTELMPQLLHVYGRLQSVACRVEGADPQSIDAVLHTIRKRVRSLRYATEAVEALDRPRYSPIVGRLIEVQNVLGRHHDAVIVEEVLDRFIGIDLDATLRTWISETKVVVEADKADSLDAYQRQRAFIDALAY